jgi:hypothetical protein
MRYGRGELTATSSGQFRKQRGKNLTANISERIAVKEKKGGAAMTLPQEFNQLFEREDLLSFLFPFAPARFLSFSINAVLRASSCARSSVVADDRLPTPVFDKSGSAL